jgi:hypothetical protein
MPAVAARRLSLDSAWQIIQVRRDSMILVACRVPVAGSVTGTPGPGGGPGQVPVNCQCVTQTGKPASDSERGGGRGCRAGRA